MAAQHDINPWDYDVHVCVQHIFQYMGLCCLICIHGYLQGIDNDRLISSCWKLVLDANVDVNARDYMYKYHSWTCLHKLCVLDGSEAQPPVWTFNTQHYYQHREGANRARDLIASERVSEVLYLYQELQASSDQMDQKEFVNVLIRSIQYSKFL